MANRNRPSQLKREREQKKRERQRKKAEKAALKREKRFGHEREDDVLTSELNVESLESTNPQEDSPQEP